jgi:predicted small secreted protein
MKERMYSNERLALMALIALVLAAILLTGCAKVLGGVGQIADGFGDGLSYVGQHLQESVEKE